jgi:signal transduction histidine kinase
LGAAFRARMVSLRRGVERITQGDLAVRIDDRESDEVGTLARTFNRMAGELQLLEDMKSQFVAVASHELRTPLTLIDGYCGILLSKGPLSDWHRERVERIHGQVQELLALVQDLLDAERLQERALAPVLEPFQPPAIVGELVRDFEAEARARGLQLKLELIPGAPASGTADVRAFTRVVRNLIDNALKYTANGEIRLLLSGEPGFLKLTITDTGCGIAPQELPRIFQRFYQVQGTVRPRRGFGLGLSIVRGLVERNQGTIEAVSTLGSGSSFTIRWPVADRLHRGIA